MQLAEKLVALGLVAIGLYIVTHSSGNGADLLSNLFTGAAKTTVALQGGGPGSGVSR